MFGPSGTKLVCVHWVSQDLFPPHGRLVDSVLTGPDGCVWWDQGLNPCPGLTFLYLLIHRVREAAMTSLMDLILLLARTEPQLIEAHV